MKRFTFSSLLLVAAVAACGPNSGEDTTADAAVIRRADAGAARDAAAPGPDADLTPYPDGGVTATAAFSYTDPSGSGNLALLVDQAGSTGTTVALKLVATRTLVGYSVGFDLPLDATKVQLNSLVPGTILSAGTNPVAAKAVLPTKGPFKDVLVVGQSQKAAGAGAVATDTTVHAGDVLFTIKLDLAAGGSAGVVFDGDHLPGTFSGGMRDKSGTDVAVSNQVRIGKLVRK